MTISNGTGKMVTQFLVNGEHHDVMIRSADTLLTALRQQLGLTGAKAACQNGDCGACTVLVDGNPTHACLSLAIETAKKPVTTIEGLSHSPMQQAFVNEWAIQCGYCTPGFIVNCHALLTKRPDANKKEIEEWLQSNICRCTGYEEIQEAVEKVLKTSGANSRI